MIIILIIRIYTYIYNIGKSFHLHERWIKLCRSLNAENSQGRSCPFLQAMDAAAEAFFKAPFFFGRPPKIELSFVFGSKLFECIFPIPGQLQ